MEAPARARMDEVGVRMSARVKQTLVRIQYPENLRVPSQVSCMEGESEPKIRPKSIVIR